MISVNNLFDYCLDNFQTNENVIYFIGNRTGNSLFTIALDNSNYKIYSYSNEYLYLLKETYPENGYYHELISYYNKIKLANDINILYNNYNVIPFITSFSTGTVHGYSGLFYILNEYVNNLNIYKDYKIIVYNDSQKGILDVIAHFIKINIINKKQVIYISSHIKYLFKSILFIPNRWHVWPESNTVELIDKYIINRNEYEFFKSIKGCIIKSSISTNITPDGIVNINNVKQFCKLNNLTYIEPTDYNEIELINIINKLKILVVSWGTAFLKNYKYISNLCKKIIVLVIGNFKSHYNDALKHNALLKKYKNAEITYLIPNKIPFNLILN